MKAGMLFIVAFLAAGGRLTAQQSQSGSGPAGADPVPFSYETRLAPLIPDDPEATRWASEAITSKHLRWSGPLAHAFHRRKLLEVPGRLLQMINPFAPT